MLIVGSLVEWHIKLNALETTFGKITFVVVLGSMQPNLLKWLIPLG